MLPGEGDQVRLIPRAAGEDGTEPEYPEDGEPAPDLRQDITDPATGLSRLLSERCPTCILRAGDPMHLGPSRTAAFIRQTLDAGSYMVCHETLSYGDFPDYGPAICRGFFDAYRYFATEDTHRRMEAGRVVPVSLLPRATGNRCGPAGHGHDTVAGDAGAGVDEAAKSSRSSQRAWLMMNSMLASTQ
jgi:hypothetical protein